MKSSSPFELIRSELEHADAEVAAADRSIQEETRLKLVRESSPEPVSLEALYLENVEPSKLSQIESSSLKARGRKIYRLIGPVSPVAKPSAA